MLETTTLVVVVPHYRLRAAIWDPPCFEQPRLVMVPQRIQPKTTFLQGDSLTQLVRCLSRPNKKDLIGPVGETVRATAPAGPVFLCPGHAADARPDAGHCAGPAGGLATGVPVSWVVFGRRRTENL